MAAGGVGAGAGRPHVGVLEVLAGQADACGRAGSDLYQRILEGAADDVRAGGVTARLLAPHDQDPLGSALALRLLGAVHRLVLAGEAPELARLYPSAGGDPSLGDPVEPFLALLREREDDVAIGLHEGVQTNEVGRSAVMAGGYAAVVQRFDLPLRILEVGSSAGLNLRFDRYCYDTGRQVAGDRESPVRFAGVWEGEPPRLPARFDVAERLGCDRHPIDPTTDAGRLKLLSFVWPDQLERLSVLGAALSVAATTPVQIAQAEAAEFVEEQLASPVEGAATVVAHSIVLQYLPPERRRRLRAAIESAGARATPRAPLAWLRMEPAGDLADVRLTAWPGDGVDQLLGTAGYHGRPIRWRS